MVGGISQSRVTRGNNAPRNEHDLRCRLSWQNSQEQRTSYPLRQECQHSHESAQPPPPPPPVAPTLAEVNVRPSKQVGLRREERQSSPQRSRMGQGVSYRSALDRLGKRGAHRAPDRQEDMVGEESRTAQEPRNRRERRREVARLAREVKYLREWLDAKTKPPARALLTVLPFIPEILAHKASAEFKFPKHMPFDGSGNHKEH
nr:uncharacterized protein LOC109166912 [Ipomoea batatas]